MPINPLIAFLVCKPLRANSVIAEAIHRLLRDVPTITIHKPVQGQRLPSLMFQSSVPTQALGNRATVMTRLDASRATDSEHGTRGFMEGRSRAQWQASLGCEAA